MAIYIFLIILVMCPLMYTTNFIDGTVITSRKKINDICAGMILVFCTVLQAIRGKSVGGDLSHYFPEFNNISMFTFQQILNGDMSSTLGYKQEIGYTLLNKIIGIIFGPGDYGFYILLLVISLLFHCALYHLIKQYSDNQLHSVLLYLLFGIFNISMNNLRSTLALAVIMLALNSALKRRYVRTLFLICFATLFHYTASVFFIFWASLFIDSRKGMTLFFVGLSTFFLLGFPIIGQFAGHISPRYANYLIADGGEKYLLFLLFFLLVLLFGVEKKFYDDHVKMVLLKVFTCGVILQLIALRASFFVRAVNYHLLGLILLFPSITLASRCKRGMGVAMICLDMLLILYYFNSILIANGTETIPYVFFWE